MKCPKVCSLNFLLVYNNKKRKEVKNHPDIFKYFKHCSCELEAHESRNLVLWIGLHVSQTQIGIRVSHFFGLLYRYISIGLVVMSTNYLFDIIIIFFLLR